VACDFFTVETIRLQTLYVLLFIHLSTRRVVAAGVTARACLHCHSSHSSTIAAIVTIAR
jgi:hypothetical protein